jgi:cytochrome b subunit of formate dehydrogenase
MPKNSRKETSSDKKLHIELVKQMLTLATSGFGLVAALAWNSLIQEFVNSYIKKWLPANSGIISLLIYAVVITVLAVFITYQLSKLSEKLQDK